jgi:hypothetical protein
MARKSEPATLSPAEILEQLEALRAQEPALNRRMEEEADLSITSGDDTQYRAAVDALAAHHADKARLEAALSGAEARTEAEAKAQRLAARAAQVERVGKFLDQRTAIVEKIETAVGELVKEWRALIALSDKAYAAFPNGPPPQGMALQNMELTQLLAAELYRQSAVAPITGRPQLERQPPTLPSPRCPNHLLLAQPEKITPLRVEIERANNLARSIMEQKANAA